MNKSNIFPTEFKVSRETRAKLLGQPSLLIWFTGLSGSGKSTLANGTEIALHQQGILTYLLDGDNIRYGLNKDLNFTECDRNENIRRIAEVCHLMLEAGLVVVSAFISPYRSERELIKNIVGPDHFMEIFVDCPLEICEQRDVKGLYQKARMGQIKNFTGIDSPYEVPDYPDLTIKTAEEDLELSIARIITIVKNKLKP